MIIDRTHSKWALGSLAALVLAAIVYALVRPAPGKLVGGTALGITFGVMGFVLMLVAGLLGAREKVPAWRIGRLSTWMRAHLWLGLLSFPIILMHGGMVFGHGLTRVLMILFTIVVVSGIVGAALQHFLPRRMTHDLPMETTFEQIDRVCEQLVKEGEDLIAALVPPAPKGGGPLKPASGLSGEQTAAGGPLKPAAAPPTAGGPLKPAAAPPTAGGPLKPAAAPPTAGGPLKPAAAPPTAGGPLKPAAAPPTGVPHFSPPLREVGEAPAKAGAEVLASYQGTASAVPLQAENEKAASAAATAVAEPPPEDSNLVTLRSYWEREVLPYLQPHNVGQRGPSFAQANQAVLKLRMLLPPTMHDTVIALQEICTERAQLAEQRKLHYWLHAWLFVHVPLSYALLLLAVVHAVDALRY